MGRQDIALSQAKQIGYKKCLSKRKTKGVQKEETAKKNVFFAGVLPEKNTTGLHLHTDDKGER
ncbi:MAG: hypothetical protein GX811_00255 [Lentisphaerae bacterium]|nr:hypothetical protein [Lentisphaerota bacterium]